LQLILDIGTHKVLGLVSRPAGDGGLEVVAARYVRHPQRSMRDGQVHDVPAVGRVIRQVKEHLEQAAGTSFSGAHIAAAGRALRTERGEAQQTHPRPVHFSASMLRHLEWEAVADAQANLLRRLPADEQPKGYYCIAHNVTASRLDGDPIDLLVGQRGEAFAVQVLATFLPGAVVDSLEAALGEAGLEMLGLTLEPIAALEAVIPPSMRHLRLALIDVGAGTADIALTGEGVVQAFGMVPQGGDAMTEAISEAFLLDFSVAEQAKREAMAGHAVTVENVLGEPVELTPETVQEATEPVIARLAERIAAEIAMWDQPRPDAVLLVGGGSQPPDLARHLAQRLDMDPRRIAVRDRRAVKGVRGADELTGPDAVTALGIALRAARGQEMPPVRVRVDGRPVCLFLPDRRTVREAARVAGISPQGIVGRLGGGLTVTINGDLVVIPGTKGREAGVRVNGQPASLDTVLQNLDDVQLSPPESGRPPRVRVGQLVEQWLAGAYPDAGGTGRARLPEKPPRIRFDDEERDVPLIIRRNGQPAAKEELVQDRDVFTVHYPRTAAELLQALELPWPQPAVTCRVNGEPLTLDTGGALLCNGAAASPDTPVHDGDAWEWKFGRRPTVQDALKQAGVAQDTTVHVTVNGRPVAVPVPAVVHRNGAPARPTDVVNDGDALEVAAGDRVTLYQVLPYIRSAAEEELRSGRRMTFFVKGEPAGFTTPVAAGDDIVIRYE